MLAFNAGSSSLKFELFSIAGERRSCLRGAVRDIGSSHSSIELDGRVSDSEPIATHEDAAEVVFDALRARGGDCEISARTVTVSAHRVVHGGERYSAPSFVTPTVLNDLRSLAHLAPLHIPASLAVLRAVRRRLESVPAVAVFDTALFHDLPDVARQYAVPRRWADLHGVRRYGFHGIAHGYMRDRISHDPGTGDRPRRLVTLQLGHGCSATAFEDGAPVETSMGFTPLEGLIMPTRPGDVDAGAILHMHHRGSAWDTLENELNRESGLRALSGVSGDARELLRLETEGHEGAGLALRAFCHRIHKYLGAYAAVLGGVDAIAFGGGIGENSPALRLRICRGLAWLGLELDDAANDADSREERRISSGKSTIGVHVIPVHEEETIARAAIDCLESRSIHETGAGSNAAIGSAER